MTEIIDGNAVAADVRDGLGDAIATLKDAGVTPGLATVLMSDDPASETYVSMKQRDCEELGIDTRDVELELDEPAEALFDTIEELNGDDDVDAAVRQGRHRRRTGFLEPPQPSIGQHGLDVSPLRDG